MKMKNYLLRKKAIINGMTGSPRRSALRRLASKYPSCANKDVPKPLLPEGFDALLPSTKDNTD